VRFGRLGGGRIGQTVRESIALVTSPLTGGKGGWQNVAGIEHLSGHGHDKQIKRKVGQTMNSLLLVNPEPPKTR
jgi:hypothetical protein